MTALRRSHRELNRTVPPLDPSAARVQDIRELLQLEQECCSFFPFRVAPKVEVMEVEAAIPDGAEECLDDLERMATRTLAAAVQPKTCSESVMAPCVVPNSPRLPR
jgi:hypothetical protein